MLLPAAILIIPRQVQLGLRLSSLEREGRGIVAYLENARLNSAYPADLSGYTFNRPANRPYFYYYGLDTNEGGFVLCFYVDHPNVSHRYSPKDGWTYYPD